MKEIELSNGKYAFEWEDIAFINTSLLTEAAQHYRKHKCYTKAPNGTLEYNEFWDIEEDRLLNGMTIPGKLYHDDRGIARIQEVHITGEHYGYLNYGRIKKTVDKGESLLGASEELVLKSRRLSGTKEIEFPDFWDGDYHYFQALAKARRLGLNIIVFKARRKGYSYKNGYVCAHLATHTPESTALIGAYDKKYLVQGRGTTVMTKNYLDWYQDKTDFMRGYLSVDIENIELGYKEERDNLPRGYRSKILTVSFMENPDAAIGKDADIMLFEEAGKFPNLKEALDVTTSTTEDGDVQTGQIILFGTGGSDEANWVVFEDLFYNCGKYDFMPFHNVWDEGRRGSACGFFHGQLLNLAPHIDEHGNSLFEKASKSTEAKRQQKRENATTENDVTKYIGQRCIKPSEGFSSTGLSIFNSAILTEHSERVANDPVYKGMGVPGIVRRMGDKATFIPNMNLSREERHDPLIKYQDPNVKDWNGCYVQYQAPYTFQGQVPEGLYRLWHDPVAFKKEAGSIHYRDSLGVTYVYEKPNSFTPSKGDVIIGAYIGRPGDTDVYNEMLLAISLYTNGEVVFERDRGDVHNYFKATKSPDGGNFEYKLAWEPSFSWNKALQSKRKGREKGVLISEGSKRKESGALLLEKWIKVVRTKHIDESLNTYNIQQFYDLGGLEELKYWNLKGNFDRVSALIIGMLDREEIFNVVVESPSTIIKNNPNDFFNRRLF